MERGKENKRSIRSKTGGRLGRKGIMAIGVLIVTSTLVLGALVGLFNIQMPPVIIDD